MVGSVTVKAVSGVPPIVNLTSPTNGAVFPAPATIGLSATATDPDGTVAKVEFFRDNISLGVDSSDPYNGSAANLAAGDYVLTARATDNQSLVSTSAPVRMGGGSSWAINPKAASKRNPNLMGATN